MRGSRGRPRAAVGTACCRASATVALLVGGCGGTANTRWAPPGTLELGWHDVDGKPGESVVVDVRRLVIREDGWTVVASVRNDTVVPLAISRPHFAGETKFGLLTFRTPSFSEVEELTRRRALPTGLTATRFEPELPRVLRPRERWSGSFSGPGRLPSGRYVRVVFGRFTVQGRAPGKLMRRFRVVTKHTALLP